MLISDILDILGGGEPGPMYYWGGGEPRPNEEIYWFWKLKQRRKAAIDAEIDAMKIEGEPKN